MLLMLPHVAWCAWMVCCLLLLATQASAVSVATGLSTGTTSTKEAQKYIFPVLLFGPCNQKRDLRNTLALAKELNTGIMLTGIFKHHSDLKQRENKNASLRACFPDGYKGFLPLDKAVDIAPMQAWLPTATVEELKAQGWDGQLDALVRGLTKGGDRMLRYAARSLQASNVTLPGSAPIYDIPGHLKCNRQALRRLKQQLQPHRYIGVVFVIMGSAEMPHLGNAHLDVPTWANTCQRSIHEASRLVRPAPWLRDLAQQYVEQQLGGKPFLAVHLRPFPDPCLDAWKTWPLQESALAKAGCWTEHRHLHKRLAPYVAKAMRDSGVELVFMVAHPAVRASAQALLQQVGITDVKFLDYSHMAAYATCYDSSTTFLLMVEEAIAAQARAFLGTHHSSITHSIVYDRLTMNNSVNTFLEFDS